MTDRHFSPLLLGIMIALVMLIAPQSASFVSGNQNQDSRIPPERTSGLLTPGTINNLLLGPINNLLLDPGFEAYTPNPFWDETSTTFGSPLCNVISCGTGGGTAGPYTGSVWGWFGGTSANEVSSLSQDVIIPPGPAVLEFYFWFGSAASGSGADDVFTAAIDQTTVFTANATDIGQYPSYQKISVDVSNFGDGALHTIMFTCTTSGQTVNFNLDDVALYDPTQYIFLPLVLR